MEAGGGEFVTPEIPALVAPDPALLGTQDADGRQPWVITRRKAEAKGNAASAPTTPSDPNHERGEQLDLQA